MARWTAQRVAQVAPDESSLKAARGLARPGPWSGTGATETLVWGVCQGSGKTPYQVSVDLVAPAYRCTCPSRKFPCKHAVALLMLWVQGPDTIADVGQAGGFAGEWAQERAEREATRASRAAVREDKAPDPVAQARRLEQRLALMDAGMEDFATWLADLVRGGTAAARQQPYRWWDDTAARLVDAQLPGLAEQVREMASEVHRRGDWADHLLGACGRWWTATRAWQRREELDEARAADLRAYVGWARPSAEVREGEAVPGPWLVLGAHRTDDGRLQQQRTWLRHETTGEVVRVLDFAAAGGALAVPQLAGAVLDVALARYPGSGHRRALFLDAPIGTGTRPELPGGTTIAEALCAGAHLASLTPWWDSAPVTLADLVLRAGDPAHVVDGAGHRLDLVPEAPVWALAALTGGHPATVFGELAEGRLRPLSVAVDGAVVSL